MVNYSYEFHSQKGASIVCVLMSKYLNELGYEGDWINMAGPYGITQYSPTHKKLVDGSSRRAPYMEMGGINSSYTEDRYCVSLRSITHITDEQRELLTERMDELIIKYKDSFNEAKPPNSVVPQEIIDNYDKIKRMVIWTNLYKHFEGGNIVFDGYGKVCFH